MTKQELRETKEYKEVVNKIKGYSVGFEFTLNYAAIPKAKGNALRIITKDLIDAGILESISIGEDLQGNFCDETYRRLNK